ncbi:hypothetical protein [Sporolactobacillus terrae]|uniref:Uncharacterized protein n=1 Tax=Sporolactobacillus terrae TaxID=269673 RepID=A0A5K7WT00_9BACL|nr:hypothetical protein [Sporolactobacillus terrae]BBN97467.1 hypothetical protein St703_01720 [Sporolactobacillus terrae]
MAELNLWSEGKKQLTLKVNDSNEQLIEKIIDRWFDRIVSHKVNLKQAPVKVNGDFKEQVPKSRIHQIVVNRRKNEIDKRIDEFIHKGGKPEPGAPSDKPKRKVVKDETIDDEAQRALPYPERVLVPASVECPSCGHNHIRLTSYGSHFTYCPECNKKLYIKEMNSTPDEYGVYAHAFEIFLDQPPVTEDDAKGSDDHD